MEKGESLYQRWCIFFQDILVIELNHYGIWVRVLKFTIKYWLLQIFWNLLCGLKIIQIFLTKIYRINQSVLVSILFANIKQKNRKTE